MNYLTLLFFLFVARCQAPIHVNSSDLVMENLPASNTEFQKMIIAQLSGAQGIPTSNSQEIRIKSRWTKRERKQTAAYFKALIDAIGLEPVVHKYSSRNLNFGVDLLIEPLKGENIYTVLPATNPSDDWVVFGAHYDTGVKNGPGALDNGSGIALILAVLRQAIALETRSKNLIVVFFDQEEEDISAGSRKFADFLLKKAYNIHSVHSYDMIGWDGDNNKEVELELPSPELEALYQLHANKLNIPIFTTTVTSSDYYSFILRDFNALGISQAWTKGDYSRKKDTPEDHFELVNFEYLESSTQLAFEVLKDIMND